MNKKGFTLIEIIICTVLITLIGTVSIFSINKKEDNNENNIITNVSKELQNVTNKIIEAANVYISVEKDSDGKIYSNGINNGGKGLQISVNNLYETGYLDEKTIKTLENKTRKDKKDLYVFISNSIKTESDEECKTNGHSYTVSWASSQEPIYLCPFNKEGTEKETLYNEILKQFETEGKTNCTIPSSGFYQGLCLTKSEKSTNNNTIYWYSGGGNNYVKLNNKIYYIVRTTENKSIILLSKDIIDNSNFKLVLTNSSDSTKNVHFNINGQISSTGSASITNRLSDYLNGFKMNYYINYNNSNSSVQLTFTWNNYGTKESMNLIYSKKSCNKETCIFNLSRYPSKYSSSHPGYNSFYDFIDYLSNEIIITNRDYLIDNLLDKWYEELNISDKYIDNEYCWGNYETKIEEGNSVRFGPWLNVVKSEYYLPSFINNCTNKKSYGTLTIGDYYAIIHHDGNFSAKLYDNLYAFYYDNSKSVISYSEVANTSNGYNNINNYIEGSYQPLYIKIRPAIVIKGDVIVNGGTGTSEDPFVLNIN